MSDPIRTKRTLPLLVLALLTSALAVGMMLLVLRGPARAQSDPPQLYVDADASGASDGSSWTDAYTDLQSALSAASDGDGIWVATGVYTPGTSATDSFEVPPGVAVYGGFAGDEASRDERDWDANPTVLSGDLAGDDADPDGDGVIADSAAIHGTNAYHVVRFDGTNTPITASTRLDGFVVTAGDASGSDPHNIGGGVICHGSGAEGECSPTMANVTFSGNRADYFGGGMGNHAHNEGVSSPTLTNVVFRGNWATYGGGMGNHGDGGTSRSTLTNVTFRDNRAGLYGGGMWNRGDGGTSSPALTNVTLSGNSAGMYGGGMFNDQEEIDDTCNPTVTNAILWGNSAGFGPEVLNDGGASPTFAYSLVEGAFDGGSWDRTLGIDGGGNVDADPLFLDAAHGNLRLGPTSPAIDAGNNLSVTVATDLAGNARVADGDGDGQAVVDMGAYERDGILALTKTASADPVTAGDQVTYTLAVTNGSAVDATEVTLRDTLPASVTLQTVDGGCTATAEGFSCVLGTLAPEETVSVTALTAVDPAALGTLTNTAQVTTAGEISPTTTTTSVTTTVVQRADLSVAKTAHTGTVDPAERITYTLQVTNGGPSAATDVVVTDTLPDGVTDVTASGSGWTCDASSLPTVTCETTSLAVGAAPELTVGVSAPSNPGVITNTAAVGSSTADPDATNDADAASVTVAVGDVPITGLAATNDGPTLVGTPTRLEAAVDAGTNVSYAWAFGDGATGSGKVVSHTYPAAGTYTAVVTATNGASQMTATTTAEVVPELYTTYLPVVAHNHVVAPDLVVEELIATPDGIQVAIRNAGDGALEDDF